MDSNDPTVFRPQPIEEQQAGMQLSPQGNKQTRTAPKRKRIRVILLIIVGVIVLALLGLVGWYTYSLQPRDAADTAPRSIDIVSGTTPSQIATTLEQKGIIRSSTSFTLYTKLHGRQSSLQAGLYEFHPSQSVAQIVDRLQAGPETNEIQITFLPGATLRDHKKVLLEHGYSEAEIEEAFAATYDHPVFASKPETADLEGYIFGETHRFTKGTPVKTILERYFDDLYAVVEKEDLVTLYQAQGLTLYQGITLASIIQRESGGDDEAQIAQVFLLRLKEGMQLGSDVTYQYIADKTGVERSTTLDSPYNTRRYTGLPPGPISSPGVASLKAVAHPAEGTYLFFLSGDDGVTYFAHTNEEHDKNIRDHCTEKCQII